jgi:hypothetical protein
MQKCQMQHWNGIVLHQVRQEVAQYKGPAVLKTENLNWDLLQRYPEIAAYIHGTLRWKPAREIHLHSLSSASAIDANGRDLTTAIPGLEKIPGSLQLLVMLGGERFYDELANRMKGRPEILSVAIGTALQFCRLVICDEFWKQLEAEKKAIETWGENFYL